MRAGPPFVVIMAGGHGTRFWPRSRRRVPKQLLAIAGRRTMLEQTVARAAGLCRPERILVVTGAEQAGAVRRLLPRVPRGNVIAEPVGRNTAPCIGLAAEIVAAREPDAVLVVLAADHVIRNTRAFRAVIRRAIGLARRDDRLVTLGIRPTRAETGYGYVQVGAPLDEAPGPPAFRVAAFHEKPDRARADEYVASGGYLWNSGMFVFRAAAVRRAIARHLPEVAAALAPVGAARTARQRELAIRRAYRRLTGVSIDTGVMERADNVAVVEAGFEWSDVGSWAAMPALWGEDENGNATCGTVVAVDSGANVVFSPKRVVALLGARDLIVVDSDDALLVCRRDRAQDMQRVLDALARRRLQRLL